MQIRKLVFAGMLVALALFSTKVIFKGVIQGTIAHDYAVYWRAANDLSQLVYAAGPKPFPYAPTMLLWISPLSLVPELVGYALLTLAGAAALFFALRPHLTNAAIALAFISPPMVRCLRNGQITVALAALLVWAFASRSRIFAGVALGVVASIKPHLVIMAPLLLALDRDWRAFASAAISFVSIAIAATLAFGLARWHEWVASMTHFHQVVDEADLHSIGLTPAMLAERLGCPVLPAMIAGAVAGAGLTYLCRKCDPVTRLAAVVTGSLLAAPYALVYDLIPVLPFLAMAAVRANMLGFAALSGMYAPLPTFASAAAIALKSIRDGRSAQAPPRSAAAKC